MFRWREKEEPRRRPGGSPHRSPAGRCEPRPLRVPGTAGAPHSLWTEASGAQSCGRGGAGWGASQRTRASTGSACCRAGGRDTAPGPAQGTALQMQVLRGGQAWGARAPRRWHRSQASRRVARGEGAGPEFLISMPLRGGEGRGGEGRGAAKEPAAGLACVRRVRRVVAGGSGSAGTGRAGRLARGQAGGWPAGAV